MKKLILTILLALIAVTAGAFYYIAKPSDSKAPSPENILPKTTIAFFQLNHLEETFNEIKNNPLGKNLQQIDLVKTAEKLKLPEKTIKKIEDFYKNINSEINRKTFFNFFGKNFTIALTSLEMTKESKKGSIETPELILLCETKTKSEFSQLFSNLFTEIKNEKKFEYKGIEITKSVYKNTYNFFHFTIKDYLIAASTEKSAKKVIEAVKSGKTLSTSPDFNEVIPTNKKIYRSHFLFVNLKASMAGINSLSSNFLGKEQASIIKDSLNKDIKCLASLGYKEKPNLSKTITKTSLTSTEKIKPEKPESFTSMVPENIISFIWLNNFDIKEIISEFFSANFVDGKNPVKNFEKNFFIKNGLKPEEVYSALSGKIGIIFSNINTSGMFPVPQISLIFEKKAGDPIEKYITRLKDEKILNFPVSTKEINGYSTKYILLPFGAAIEPSWAYTKDNFIVSVNTALFKEITDALKANKNITKNPLYKFVASGFPEKVNAISFFNTKKLMEDLILTSEALLRLASMKGPEASEKGTIILNDVLKPVCKGLSSYEATAGVNYNQGKMLTGESFTKIPD